jgi:hypothetical protein
MKLVLVPFRGIARNELTHRFFYCGVAGALVDGVNSTSADSRTVDLSPSSSTSQSAPNMQAGTARRRQRENVRSHVVQRPVVVL